MDAPDDELVEAFDPHPDEIPDLSPVVIDRSRIFTYLNKYLNKRGHKHVKATNT